MDKPFSSGELCKKTHAHLKPDQMKSEKIDSS